MLKNERPKNLGIVFAMLFPPEIYDTTEWLRDWHISGSRRNEKRVEKYKKHLTYFLSTIDSESILGRYEILTLFLIMS
jgi:hypothetical protein